MRLSLALLILLLLGSCLPQPGAYPFREPALLRAEAQGISDSLEAYVRLWLAGKAPREIPARLIPPGIDSADNRRFVLQRYDQIDPTTHWVVRPAEPLPVNSASVKEGLPDPHVTYLLLGTSLAPFGTRVHIEGDFPHCRFFSVQISPPFDGLGYSPSRAIGSTENSIVDADIVPEPGSSNPFRPGADRRATSRRYHLQFDLRMGDPRALDSSFKPPYRGPGNRRAGALLIHQGPWWKKLGGKGPWNAGLIWVRYYAPDRAHFPMAGAPLPKVWYELPTGERYYIHSDFSGFVHRVNSPRVSKPTAAKHPPAANGPTVGWAKSYGILQSIGLGIYEAWGGLNEKRLDYVRRADHYATGRAEAAPAPHHYEPHATTNNYATYLGRSFQLGAGQVIVLTGRLPLFPDTRGGAATMPTGQLRYWSIGGYDYNIFAKTLTCNLHSVMDDELTLNADREYTLVYSRAQDRPANATAANGVTWVDWGPISEQGLIIRWVSVEPEWAMSPNPHERELPWPVASKAGTRYDPRLLGTNDQRGHLGAYLPRVAYMSQAQFEALGPIRRSADPPMCPSGRSRAATADEPPLSFLHKRPR